MSGTPEATSSEARHRALRLIAFLYGVGAFALTGAALLWFTLFLAGILLPKSAGSTGPVTAGALVADLLLVGLFGAQHSLMARPGFKRIWTRLVPPPVERSTYVLFSTAALVILMAFWHPLPGLVWHVRNPIAAGLLWAASGLGCAMVVAGAFDTDPYDLVGLRQVWLFLVGRPYAPVAFRARGLYRHMRHPLYSGLFLTFWATPEMPLGRLVLVAGLSLYTIVGTLLEERDLLASFGDRYRAYSATLPRYVPRLKPPRGLD